MGVAVCFASVFLFINIFYDLGYLIISTMELYKMPATGNFSDSLRLKSGEYLSMLPFIGNGSISGNRGSLSIVLLFAVCG